MQCNSEKSKNKLFCIYDFNSVLTACMIQSVSCEKKFCRLLGRVKRFSSKPANTLRELYHSVLIDGEPTDFLNFRTKSITTEVRGEYNVLFGDKGNGIVFGFSANFGNVLGGAKRRPKYFQKMIKHFRKIILQNISHKEAKHFQK